MIRKDDITKVRERVEVDLRHHIYTCLCSNETVETWLCKRPGTNCYLFTITITPYNIFVGGDIDEVSYRVGSRYGFGFLAENGASEYAQSKLASVYSYDRILDTDAIIEYALRHYWSNLHEDGSDDVDTRCYPKPGEDWDAYVKRSVAAIYDSWDDPDHGHKGELDNLVDFLNIDCEDADVYVSDDMEHREVIDALADIGIGDSWECRVHKPRWGLLYSMEAAAHAARKILEIRAAKAAGQQQIAEATGAGMTENYYEMKDGAKVYVGSRLGHGQCIEFLLAGGMVDAKYSYAAPISADESFTIRLVGHQSLYTPWRTDTGNTPRLPIMSSYGWLHCAENSSGEGWHACCVRELPPSVPAPESAPGVDYKAISEQLRKDLDCVVSTLMNGIDCCRDANSPVEAADLAVKYLAELTRADQRKPDDFQVMIRELEDMAYTSVVARDVLRQIRSTSDYATYLRIILGLIKLNHSTMSELLNSRMREAPPWAKDGSHV